MLSISGSLFAQSTVKHILTQGDTFLIAAFANLWDQGIYAFASGYGSLLARMVFQPIEESSRNLFAKVLSQDQGGKPDLRNLRSANKILTRIVRAYLLLGIVAGALGPTYAPFLLRIVAGSRWSSSRAGQVLVTYCYYIPLLALNGVTEAFVSAVATTTELNSQSLWMFAFSTGFAGAAYLFVKVLDWGAEGLVWANAINMLFRIIWSGSFITRYFHRHTTNTVSSIVVVDVLPRPATFTLGVLVAAVCRQIQAPSSMTSIKDLATPAFITLSTLMML